MDTAKTQEKTTGFGSIWNNNSWFYEEKNYTAFAKEYLSKELPKLFVSKDDIYVRLYEVKSIEGAASVTIRKQKQIFLYDFEIEVYFDAKNVNDEAINCKGKIKFHEFNQDDDELAADITCEQATDFAAAVKKILNKEITEAAMKTIHSLGKAMREKDADEIKVKQDQMAREEAKKKVEEAKEKTGEIKDQIFQEAKLKEEEMKRAEEEKAKNNLVPLKPVEKINTVQGQGSVWNNNSYHWEQKSVDKWAEETLKKVLSLFQFKYEKATLHITEVKDLKGESSVSIRKQKKIVTYDYNAKLVWKCDMADESNTKVIGSITGEYLLPEISSDILDDGEEWDI